MRGGHQMAIDARNARIYLLGGWDGTTDLADFWVYHCLQNEWNLISENTEAEGGPSKRSCHKMILHQELQQIFVFGRYVDSPDRITENLKADFYVYDIQVGVFAQNLLKL